MFRTGKNYKIYVCIASQCQSKVKNSLCQKRFTIGGHTGKYHRGQENSEDLQYRGHHFCDTGICPD